MLTHILPGAIAEALVLADVDRLRAGDSASNGRDSTHWGVSFIKCVRFVRTCQETTTDHSPIDAVASIGFNGVLLLNRAQTHASEDASSYVSVRENVT